MPVQKKSTLVYLLVIAVIDKLLQVVSVIRPETKKSAM